MVIENKTILISVIVIISLLIALFTYLSLRSRLTGSKLIKQLKEKEVFYQNRINQIPTSPEKTSLDQLSLTTRVFLEKEIKVIPGLDFSKISLGFQKLKRQSLANLCDEISRTQYSGSSLNEQTLKKIKSLLEKEVQKHFNSKIAQIESSSNIKSKPSQEQNTKKDRYQEQIKKETLLTPKIQKSSESIPKAQSPQPQEFPRPITQTPILARSSEAYANGEPKNHKNIDSIDMISRIKSQISQLDKTQGLSIN